MDRKFVQRIRPERVFVRMFSFTAVAFLSISLVACSSPSTMATSVEVSDAWVKAVEDVSDGMAMTGYFMVVTNTSDYPITIVSGSVDESITMEPVETHEVVKDSAGDMVMQEANGGITIPAHDSLKLMPGGFHLMLFSLREPILTGQSVPLTIEFADGSHTSVSGTAYSIENGIEKYVPEAKIK